MNKKITEEQATLDDTSVSVESLEKLGDSAADLSGLSEKEIEERLKQARKDTKDKFDELTKTKRTRA